MNTFILVAVALFPAIFLCVYVFKKDRVEKEPAKLLFLLLLAGILISIPVLLISPILEGLINGIFAPFTVEENGEYVLPEWLYTLYTAADNFIGVALVEEGMKWLALILITKNNKNFNSLFDGMIYAIFISLGFAGFENVLYAFSYGLDTALVRMVTSVPGHMFFAVFMGYYYSWYHIKVLARDNERILRQNGLVPTYGSEIKVNKDLVYSLLIPILAHGFYDFCCSIPYNIATIAFVAFVIILYIVCFARIKKMSAMDMIDKKVVLGILYGKYREVATAYTEYVTILNQQNGDEAIKNISMEALINFMLYKKQNVATYSQNSVTDLHNV